MNITTSQERARSLATNPSRDRLLRAQKNRNMLPAYAEWVIIFRRVS